MAEFLGQEKPEKIGSGFDAMGKPIPLFRKIEADKHLKEMGISNVEERFRCIARVSSKLERDDPYGAMSEAMRWIDLTGTYRLFAVLLTGEEKHE